MMLLIFLWIFLKRINLGPKSTFKTHWGLISAWHSQETPIPTFAYVTAAVTLRDISLRQYYLVCIQKNSFSMGSTWALINLNSRWKSDSLCRIIYLISFSNAQIVTYLPTRVYPRTSPRAILALVIRYSGIYLKQVCRLNVWKKDIFAERLYRISPAYPLPVYSFLFASIDYTKKYQKKFIMSDCYLYSIS